MQKPPRKGHPIPSETTLDPQNLTHPAVREIHVGRGYGVTIVPTVDLMRFKTGRSFHIQNGGLKPLCGANAPKAGGLGEMVASIDAHAVIVSGVPVCVRCRDLLGTVPMPRLLKGDE